jgi:hypothetical protein
MMWVEVERLPVDHRRRRLAPLRDEVEVGAVPRLPPFPRGLAGLAGADVPSGPDPWLVQPEAHGQFDARPRSAARVTPVGRRRCFVRSAIAARITGGAE